MAQSNSQLRFLAQPQSSYRERYISELDPRRNRAQRFVRAESNFERFDYPTIEILKKWQNQNRRLYIRVTLTTVLSDQVPVRCVHPYPIDSTEMNVIKDLERNTLYFQISDEEFDAGRKSFRIIRKKLIQYELRNYGQLRLLDEDERDIQRINDPNDARKLIDLYQLGKSQLVFSLAELVHKDQYPILYVVTSVYSNVMTAVTSTSTTANDDDLSIRCVPQKGYWQGGDEILMVLPRIDRRKTCKIIFEHPLMNNTEEIQIDFVDTKTIAFITPPCPVKAIENQKLEIPIVVIQGNEEIARINFLYQSFNRCLACTNTNFLFDSFDESNTYEQSTTMDTCFDIDTFVFNHDSNNKTENDLSGN